MRLEDRRRIFDHYVPDLMVSTGAIDVVARLYYWSEIYEVERRHVDATRAEVLQVAAFATAIRGVGSVVELLSWTERTLWDDLVRQVRSAPSTAAAPLPGQPEPWLMGKPVSLRADAISIELIHEGPTSPLVRANSDQVRRDLISLSESERYQSSFRDFSDYLRRAIAPRLFDRVRNGLLKLRLVRRFAWRLVVDHPIWAGSLLGILAVVVYLTATRW